jgi:hypothetical protein
VIPWALGLTGKEGVSVSWIGVMVVVGGGGEAIDAAAVE